MVNADSEIAKASNGEASSSSFNCFYCQTLHAQSHASREHIVPDAISTQDYVLSPVCKFRNNYFSLAFEQAAIQSRVFSLLRSLFVPPNRIVIRISFARSRSV